MATAELTADETEGAAGAVDAPSTDVELRVVEIPAEDVAEEIGNVGDLKRKSKVRAFVDLPGVPEGTRGLIALVNGWEPWVRYRVLFDNGVDYGPIERDQLVPAKEYDDFAAKRTAAIESGVFDVTETEDAADEGAADAGAGGGGGGDVVVNGVTIPGHLIEKAKAARARLTGG